MSMKGVKPDVAAVMQGLKDFQRRTADYVFRRMYLDRDATRRFLIADEVGLGKTLVARGLIAKAIDHLWDQVDRIDVVYICSNADIAQQNIDRLNVTGADDFQLASRITLLPIRLRNLKSNKLNFVSFTPGTSFDLKQSMGTAEERTLLYRLLQNSWNLSGTGPLNVLQGGAGMDSFRDRVRTFDDDDDNKIDDTVATLYAQALVEQGRRDQTEGRQPLRERFAELCKLFGYARTYIPDDQRVARAKLIGELRSLLAATCLRALEPDLIILDEFQRFKHLLEGDSEARILAQRLFDYSDTKTKARVVLLSATPYKMYTMHHESEEDDHYQDFLRTMSFLLGDPATLDELKQLIRDFRRGLYRLRDAGATPLVKVKDRIESILRRHMVRTERLAVAADRNGMLTEVPARALALRESDVASYCALQDIARRLDHGDTVEYWKSAPYLLNFMDDYDLKRSFDEAVGKPGVSDDIRATLAKGRGLLLPWADIASYRAVDPDNARLRALMDETLGTGAWRLLWMPPALPYYRPAGPFADAALERFTKRLVFSSWRVVPKVISTLLSYEAERRMMTSYEPTVENTPEARKKRTRLLEFGRSDGRLTGMPVLGILYPSSVLARECDPLRFAAAGADAKPTEVAAVLKWARVRAQALLTPVMAGHEQSGPPDESWYWAAPILIDLHHDRPATRAWFSIPELAQEWTGQDGGLAPEVGESHWAEHVRMARDLVAGGVKLGRPPSDLADVLAWTALGGLGTVSLRTLVRVAGPGRGQATLGYKSRAATVAWSFLTLFNRPEVTALLRGINSAEPYWRRVLEYSVHGCLQAVLDEYAHVLKESLSLREASQEKIVSGIAQAISEPLSLRAASLGVDEIRPDGSIEARRMRIGFAGRLADESGDDGSDATRAEQVRGAFNSPFWPFVLATTSVGQEGLDFHPYCHAVVHWNLPSNPVDLEQREGRVHRYKGHAVRKNLARRHGAAAVESHAGDPWHAMFQKALRERAPGETDLVPYWVYPVEGGARIERHVPALPLSRDHEHLAALRRSLAVYRMVFGQARQEELLAYLQDRVPAPDLESLLQRLRVDLSPPDGTVSEACAP